MTTIYLLKRFVDNRGGEHFAGVSYAHQLKVMLGQCLNDLELLAKAGEPEDFVDWVEYYRYQVGCRRV